MQLSFMEFVCHGYDTQKQVTSMLQLKQKLPDNLSSDDVEKIILEKFKMSSQNIY